MRPKRKKKYFSFSGALLPNCSWQILDRLLPLRAKSALDKQSATKKGLARNKCAFQKRSLANFLFDAKDGNAFLNGRVFMNYESAPFEAVDEQAENFAEILRNLRRLESSKKRHSEEGQHGEG